MNDRPTAGQRLREGQARSAAARNQVLIDQLKESDPEAARELANPVTDPNAPPLPPAPPMVGARVRIDDGISQLLRDVDNSSDGRASPPGGAGFRFQEGQTVIGAPPTYQGPVTPPPTPAPPPPRQQMIPEYNAAGDVIGTIPFTPPPPSAAQTASANRAVDRVQTAQTTLEALDNLPPTLRVDQSQLEQQRLAAQRQLVDARADLALTNHSVPALTNTAAQEPQSAALTRSITPTPTIPALQTPTRLEEQPPVQGDGFGPGNQSNTPTAPAVPQTPEVPLPPPAPPGPPAPAAAPGPAAAQSQQTQSPGNPTASIPAPVREESRTAAAPATAAQTGLAAAAPDITFNFEPNAHNQYDRVTYNFKLSMVNDSDAEDINIGQNIRNNSIRKVIVAQSGVTTGFNITDVEIQDMVSSNFRSRGNMTTEVRFTLVEPYSLTLPDKMYAASVDLGLPNWRLAPMFLELEFKYIKADGSLYTPTQGNLVKVYQIVIVDFDSQITEVGSTYQIKSMVQGNRGFADAFNILPQTHSVVMEGANTNVKSFFVRLGEIITDLYIKERAENRNVVTPIMVYKFVVTEKLGEQEINFTQQSNQRRANFTQATPGGQITVSRGISISALIDDIMASLKDPKFFITRPDADGAVRIPRIECRTRNIGWDGLLNDYVREFTFVISTKDSVRPVPFREYGEAFQSNPDLQKARLEWLAEYMKKSYDYYYTGLNTEVLNLDIKFNQLHSVVTPLMNTVPFPQYANASLVEGFTAEYNQARAARDQNLSITNLIRNAPEGLGDPDANAARQLSQAELELANQNTRLQEILQQSIIFFDPENPLREQVRGPAGNSEREAEFRNRIVEVRENNRRAASRKEFLEDTPKRDPATLIADSLRLSYITDPRDMANMQARAAGGGNQTPEGANNPQDSTRALVTSIITQIYDKSYQMLDLDMKIKGDPYWLGVSDVDRMKELSEFVEAATSTGRASDEVAASRSDTAEWFNRDTVFLLKFRAGAPPSVTTGFQNLNNESDFFYGIYTAIEITHEFKNGMFTQQLKATRDMLINVSTIRQAQSRTRNPTQPPVANAGPSATGNAPTGAATPGAGPSPGQPTQGAGETVTPRAQTPVSDPNQPADIVNPPVSAYERASNQIMAEQRARGEAWSHPPTQEVVARMPAADRVAWQDSAQLQRANAARSQLGLAPLSRLG
jgi:hypothetical protein